MKTLALTSLALLLAGTVPVLAQSAPSPQPGNFAQHQQVLLTRLASQISILQQEQTCIQGATDQPSLRSCREQAKTALQSLRQQRKQ